MKREEQKMPKKGLQDSFQTYISKLKKPSCRKLQIPSAISSRWICTQPRTPSFAIERGQPKHLHTRAATLSDVDRFLYENFQSLYRDDIVIDEADDKEVDPTETPTGFSPESPTFKDPPPEIQASQRFFVSPGLSNSLIEEAMRFSALSTFEDIGSTSTDTLRESATVASEMEDSDLPRDTIAVITSSVNPYDDFRRSMQEMVEARVQRHGTVDWDFMEELLFRYLRLNEKKTYRYILSAFVDLIVLLRQNPDKAPAKSSKKRSGERRKKETI